MSVQQKKFNIKIPENTLVIFSEKKQTLTIVGPLTTKSMKLKLKVTIDKFKKILSVSPLPFFHMSNAKKKKDSCFKNCYSCTNKTPFNRKFNHCFPKAKNNWSRIQD